MAITVYKIEVLATLDIGDIISAFDEEDVIEQVVQAVTIHGPVNRVRSVNVVPARNESGKVVTE